MNALLRWWRQRRLDQITERLARLEVLIPYWQAKRTMDGNLPGEVVYTVADLIGTRAILLVRKARLEAALNAPAQHALEGDPLG